MTLRFRKKAREDALIVLYRWDIRGDSAERVFKEYIEEKEIKNREVLEYSKKLVDTVLENLMEIDSLISSYSQEWSFNRLGYIERNV